MDRINRILKHPLFIECIKLNEMAEAKRSFCHHDMEHLCAVARIAMLLNLEENAGLSKDLVYGAAFLHDCGRYKQYEEGIPHDKAGAELAALILPECGYSKEEIETANYTDMYDYYSQEQIEKYGVLGIELYDISFSKNCT